MNLFLASSIRDTGKDILKRVETITQNRRLLFISTASEGEKGDLTWIDDDRKSLENHGFSVEKYTITGKNQKEIAEKLKIVGSVCVGGGNTYYLLHQVRKSGFDQVITEFVKNGLIYIGASAGSLLAGTTVETSLDNPEVVPELTDYKGLNLIDVSIRTHWGNMEMQNRYRREMDRLYDMKQKMIFLRDNQYLHVKDDWYKMVSVVERTG